MKHYTSTNSNAPLLDLVPLFQDPPTGGKGEVVLVGIASVNCLGPLIFGARSHVIIQ